MKRKHYLNLRYLLLLVGVILGVPSIAQVQSSGPKPVLKPSTPTMVCRVDLTVTDILFGIVNQTSPTTGVVSITGVITNRGNKEYRSEIQQQSILLFENGTLKLVRPFKFLGVNQQEMIVYQRNWNTSANAQGGNPPSYRVAVAYSDDILTDSNLDNNDCNLTNNLMFRSGDRINDLFVNAK